MGVEARQARAPPGDQPPKLATAAAAAAAAGNNRTLPKCVRCRNHNEVSLLSGHKRFCRFRHCVCKDCMRTVKRQKKMAKQIAHRRRKKLEDERTERGEPVPAATPSPSTSSIDSVEPPTVPSRWFPYSENSERSRHGAYEQNVSSTSSSSGISSSHSNAAYATSCRSPTGSVISVTALSDTDGAWPSDQRLRLAEMGSSEAARHSPGPVDLESVARLTGMVRRQGVDTETLLYVILSIVCPNVDEAYNRILTAQDEVRSLRGSLSPTPPLSVGRPGDAVTSSSGSPTPPSLYRTLPTHPLPPPPHHPATSVIVPRAMLGATYYPAHLPLFGPIPTRLPLGLTPPFSHLSSFEEQYRSGNLRAASLSLANVEESRRFQSI